MPGTRKAKGRPASSADRTYWVWVFGEIAGLRWVLEHQQMAFPAAAEPRLARMDRDDRAVLYVSRGAFHNPTRDTSRLAGLVTVVGRPRRVRRPIVIAGREFTMTVPIRLDVVLPEREGPEVAPLARQLSFVSNPATWGMAFRTSPRAVPERDFVRLARAIERAAS